MSGAETAEILFAEQGGLGRTTLNCPKAINALTHGMIRAIDAALSAWEENAAIKIILIDGTGERGFLLAATYEHCMKAQKAETLRRANLPLCAISS